MDKARKIKTERDKLEKLFVNAPQNRLKLVTPLIENAAFMKVTLDELQASINENGASEEYKNGENQFGRKASADLQAYNSTMKIYSSVIDKLERMLPEEVQKSKLGELMDE